jgi:hypothetical protein
VLCLPKSDTKVLINAMSGFGCQPNSSKLKAEGSKVDGQGSDKALKLESSMAIELRASWIPSLEPSALSQFADTRNLTPET